MGRCCKCTFGWSSLLITLLTFLSLVFLSCVHDSWMVNHHTTTDEPWLRISPDGLHQHASAHLIHPDITPQRVRYFGIWEVCDHYDPQHCTDTDVFLRHRIVETPTTPLYWLHILRFFVVISLISIGFGVVIGFYTVINNSKTASLAYMMNSVGVCLMAFVLAYMHSVLPYYMPSYFRFTVSYFVSWGVVGGGAMCTGLYVACKIWTDTTTESWKPWQDL